MEHEAKGESKLMKRCNLPLTGAGVVDMVITDLGVFEIDRSGKNPMKLIELATGVTAEEIARRPTRTTSPPCEKARPPGFHGRRRSAILHQDPQRASPSRPLSFLTALPSRDGARGQERRPFAKRHPFPRPTLRNERATRLPG